jgi:hypothetical protein
MNVLQPALSLSNTFTQVGAIAAFAALLGIAILSLLAFSQAREIKRLREWAGRAPERASELEQRVSVEAAARMQRTATPVGAARVIPRKTPLVSAPVSTAVHATAANATGIAASPVSPNPSATPNLPIPGAQPAAAPIAGTPAAASTPVAGAISPAPAVPEDESEPSVDESAPAKAEPTTVNGQAPHDVQPVGNAQSPSAQPLSEPAQAPVAGTPAPATAAAQAAGVAARPSLPPSPASPSPPGPSAIPLRGAASAAAGAPVRSASSSSAPVAAARRTPSRAVAGAPPRAPVPPRASAPTSGVPSERTPDAQPGASGPKYFKPERTRARGTALIVAGVIAVVLVAVVAVLALKGGGSATPTTHGSTPTSSAKARPAASHGTVSNPADVAVTVLNGTETNGLAHHLAGDLQQSGYARAAASAAVPPGTHATTVVEYAAGHRADGQAVAKALDVKRVQAIEGSIASLASTASVVVVAGADQAAQLGGGGAQSKGEPAASTAGTDEPVSGSAAGSGEAGAGAGESAAGSGN